MNVVTLASDHIAQKVYTAIKEAQDTNTIIESIVLTPTEFDEFVACETVKSTASKWYGSNEGGLTFTNIETASDDTPKGFHVISGYFIGVKILRG